MSRYGEPLRRERDERIQADADPSRPLSADDIVAALDGMATLAGSHPRFEVATQWGFIEKDGCAVWAPLQNDVAENWAHGNARIRSTRAVRRTVYIGPTEDVDVH